MIADNVTSFSEAAARRGRKSVSFQDKLEEARERRAVALSRQPMSDPLPSQAAPGPRIPLREVTTPVAAPATIEPVAPPRDEAAARIETPQNEPERQKTTGMGLKWMIRGLTVLLLALSGIALSRLPSQTPALPPDFSPPLASLTAQAYGPPLLATISYRNDRPLRTVEGARLADPAPVSVPVVRTAAPAPRGPKLMPTIDTPVPPRAIPATLVVLPNDVRPPERP